MFKEIKDELLETFMLVVRPVIQKEGVLYYIKPPNPRTQSFIWQPTLEGVASNLVLHRTVETYHTFSFHGFFKPSIAECLAHMRAKDLKEGVIAFECDFVPHSHWSEAVAEVGDKMYHRGITKFYREADAE